MATQLLTKICDLGSPGVPGLASMVGGQTSWLARMFGLCQDDIILAWTTILACPKVCQEAGLPLHPVDKVETPRGHFLNPCTEAAQLQKWLAVHCVRDARALSQNGYRTLDCQV